MKFAIIESPFAPKDKSLKKEDTQYIVEVEENQDYARQAVHYLLTKNIASFASHLFYTQPNVLDDTVPEERKLGIDAGLEIAKRADLSIVFLDYGISSGMIYGVKNAIEQNRPIQLDTLIWQKGYEINLERTVPLFDSFKVLSEEFGKDNVENWISNSNKNIQDNWKEYVFYKDFQESIANGLLSVDNIPPHTLIEVKNKVVTIKNKT